MRKTKRHKCIITSAFVKTKICGPFGPEAGLNNCFRCLASFSICGYNCFFSSLNTVILVLYIMASIRVKWETKAGFLDEPIIIKLTSKPPLALIDCWFISHITPLLIMHVTFQDTPR